MTTIEDRLRDAMRAKAETVRDDGRSTLPPPSSGRARDWWAPVAVAAAIVLVVTVTVVATRTVTLPAPAVRPTLSSGTLAPPVTRVWPGAVHEIPTMGPDGGMFKPDVFVSDRVVVGRGLTRNRLSGIWSYDVDTRRFTRIAQIRDVRVMNAPLVFGDGYLAWSTFRDRMTEIWAVPVTGGTPRRLASITGLVTSDNSYGGIDLAVADGMAVWSPYDGGVYRVPLRGGQPSLVQGTRGYYLLDWPWAGWPPQDRTLDHPVPRPMEHVRNVLTDERRDAVPPAGRSSWNACGVTWCVNGVESWRRDGTGLHGLPGTAQGDELYSGRFILLNQKSAGGAAVAVYDLATGRTGQLFSIPTRRGDQAPPTLNAEEGMFWYQTGRGTQVLVNLTAAGRS
ncbi:hypothetical protein [Nonomuraea sediminis]|uniref:hypothetical protein n=1 Tax=Nonomuraea sediminis TaxID=2835864 RepID=UPI001BDBD295|nr:hypothetical protein [Nonomuraea sediminis]